MTDKEAFAALHGKRISPDEAISAYPNTWLLWQAAVAHERSKAPAWHDKPTTPGDYVLLLESGMEMQEQITQKEIDEDQHWPGRWYGPIPSEDKP